MQDYCNIAPSAEKTARLQYSYFCLILSSTLCAHCAPYFPCTTTVHWCGTIVIQCIFSTAEGLICLETES